ncbi:MAG: hypothetical protein LBV47_07380 [Bacteroidales bacterium]|nr:hypothetical protein [Bacteroidales bacterium]
MDCFPLRKLAVRKDGTTTPAAPVPIAGFLTIVRTNVKNTAFAGMEQERYTQITHAMMFKVTVERIMALCNGQKADMHPVI